MAIADSLGRIAASKGRNFDLVYVTTGGVDPETGDPSTTYTPRTVKALRIEPFTGFVRGGLVVVERTTFLFPRKQPTGGDLVEPKAGDRVVDGSSAYVVGGVRPIDIEGGEQAWFAEVAG